MATTSSSVNYFQVLGNSQPVDHDIKELKRLIAWKNLRIKSISINSESITIEGMRNKKTYFVVISKTSIAIFDNKMKELDRIEIPVPYEDIYKWGKTTIGGGTTSIPWTYTTDHTSVSNPWITTTNTSNDYIVDSSQPSSWVSSSCYKVSFE